jgi:diguanylate cyclase (GGDEF)-like protein
MSTTAFTGAPPQGSPESFGPASAGRQGAGSIAPPVLGSGGHGNAVGVPPSPVRTAVQGVAAIAALVYALHALLGFGGQGMHDFCQDWLFNGLIVVSGGLCVERAVTVRAERAGWLVLGLGLLAWAAAEIDYTLAGTASASSEPGLRDALSLAFYPASYAAMVLVLRSRVSRLRPALWLDGLISALATAAVAAALLVEPVVHASGGYASMAATDLAYSLGDLILVVFVVAVFGLTGWRPGRAWLLLGAGFLLTAIADTVFLYQSASGSYVEGGWVDALWPTGALLLGFAASQRGNRLGSIVLAGWRVLLIPALCAVLALGLLVYGNLHPLGAAAIALATATLLISVLRMALLFAENLKLAALNSRQAMTDPLTGLGNRRQLLDDLRDAIHAGTAERPWTLLIFDLDGFKSYNDSFGHPAGDALLTRLGRRLSKCLDGNGEAYRLGGDEFCALLRPMAGNHDALRQAAVAALTDGRDRITVTGSHGAVSLPVEASDVSSALQVADRRLYAEKRHKRRAAAFAEELPAQAGAAALRVP